MHEYKCLYYQQYLAEADAKVLRRRLGLAVFVQKHGHSGDDHKDE